MTRRNGSQDSLNLVEIAREAMLKEGFEPDFSSAVHVEVNELLGERPAQPSIRDMRSVLWSSIDNQTSRDLDQVEFVQTLDDGQTAVLVGIADVDSFVKKDSATDNHASTNTTSVYTGVMTFAMLPEELSTDKTSLVQGEDRLAIVIDFIVDKSGSATLRGVYPALVRNHAKLVYESVGRWLEENGPAPDEVKQLPELESQLRLQFDVAKNLQELRKAHGALELATIQTTPVTDDQGRVIDLAADEPNRAKEIIENFMVAANVAMAEFLQRNGVTSLLRVVRTPENWPRIVEIASELGGELPTEPNARALQIFLDHRREVDPTHFPDLSLAIIKLLGPGEYVVDIPGQPSEGHFGLAVHNYTHSTAPNRRFADLTIQRMLKACVNKLEPPYTVDELRGIAAHCTEREDAARKVERKMRKVAGAMLLRDRIGQQFDAIVTGISQKGTFARVIKPSVDGLIVEGQHGLKVGQQIRVKLVDTNPEKGFIDFAVVASHPSNFASEKNRS